MAYIGVKPTIGNFQICDAISVVNGQAAYTMQVGSVNVSPQSANHMIVSLNGVIQKPGSSYTVSGNTITFASNLATGDVIDFIQILGDVLDLGVPSDATVTAAKLTANSITGQTAETSIATDDTVLIHDTSAGALRKMTRANFVSGVGGTNTPSFFAYSGATQNPADTTNTTVAFGTEVYDTDSCYNNSTYTFTPNVAGKYYLFCNIRVDSDSGTHSLIEAQARIRKNGGNCANFLWSSYNSSNLTAINMLLSTIVDANGSSDAFLCDVYLDKDAGTNRVYTSQHQTYFGGYKLIGV